jgi:catechol 2,3-dioxygenase-like lactoylglutathione lyase family enzyme
MDPHISIITLGVTDLDRSTRFYEQGLGLAKMNDMQGIAFFPMGGVMLGLYPRDKLGQEVGLADAEVTFPSMTLAHNVESPARVDEVLQEAVRAGARLVKPGQDAFWGGYSGYFADPDGHYWEVAWNPYF